MMPVESEFSNLCVKRLSRDAQFRGGARGTRDQALRIAQRTFNHCLLSFRKVRGQQSRGRSHLGSRARKPGFIYKEGLPFRQNHRSLDYVLQLADVSRPIIRVEEFHSLLVYVSNLLARFWA